MPTRRPYTQDEADRICDRIAEDRSLRAVCRDEDTPSYSLVKEWLREHPDFVAQYARACEARAEMIFDEILKIADTPLISRTRRILAEQTVGPEDQDGRASRQRVVEITEADDVARRRLQIDARKWMLGRMAPKKYGNRYAPRPQARQR